MQEPGSAQKRFDVPHFEGVNSTVGFHVANKSEFFHGENFRCIEIGTIQKRPGQTVLGTAVGGGVFTTANNYGLFYFPVPVATNQGLYRFSQVATPGQATFFYLGEGGIPTTVSLIYGGTGYTTAAAVPTTGGSGTGLTVNITAVVGLITVITIAVAGTGYHNGETLTVTTGDANATFTITTANAWTPLTLKGAAVASGDISTATDGKNMYIVNFNDNNRYIVPNGTTVFDSTDAAGQLFNSPRAKKINYYKNRLYLANYITTGVTYPTTVLRSSFPLGIVALLNQDNPSAILNAAGQPPKTTEIFVDGVPTSPKTYNADIQAGATKLFVTDTKYFYDLVGARDYEVYRGFTKVADITIVPGGVHETSIDVTYSFSGTFNVSGKRKFLASDEVWISGTYTGDKIFRWMNNSSVTGRDVKQYDTFKLSGGDNDGITLMENVGNVMMVGNKNGLGTWNDYTLENFDLGIGSVSSKGYIKLMGSLYFLHYTGIYATTGGAPQIVSNKIERYITGATKSGKEGCVAGKKGRSIFFTLGNVTLYNADHSVDKVLPDACAEYNLTTQNWYIHTNVKTTHFATFLEFYDPDRLVLLSTTGDHAAKEFLLGDTDDGEEIFMRADLNKITFQSQYENTNTMNSLIVESERGNSLKVFVSIAEGINEWFELEGVVEKGISILKISPQDNDRGEPTPCRLLNISLRDSSKQTPKLTRLAVTYVPQPNPSIVQ